MERRFCPAMPRVSVWTQLGLGAVAMVLWLLSPCDSRAQSNDELELINQRAIELYRAGTYAAAIPFAARYADGIKALYGEDHANYAVALSNLAHVLQATSRHMEAETLYRRALAIDDKNFGPDQPRIALRLNNLGELLRTTNRFAEAEPLMRRALAIDEKSFGPNHPDVARDLNNLALLFWATRRLEDAAPLM